jgi:hypothetical protein
MIKIVQRKGLELITVCGETLLVATKEAYGACPYVNRLGKLSARYWRLLSEGRPMGEIVRTCAKEMNIDPRIMARLIFETTNRMLAAGYLIKEDTEDE